jgi:hypothetical protein
MCREALSTHSQKDHNCVAGLLTIQLMKPFPHLKLLIGLLSKLEKHKKAKTFYFGLKASQFRQLFKELLRLAYEDKVPMEDYKSKGLNETYDHLRTSGINLGSRHNGLNVNKVFEHITVSKQLLDQIRQELDSRINIFQTLLKSPAQSACQLYKGNNLCLSLNHQVQALYNQHYLQASSPPTFQYALFLYYFSAVRHSHFTSMGLLKAYRLRLTALANTKGRNLETGDTNSATLQVDLAAGRCGNILATSLNYFEFLGWSSTEQAIGRNLKELLPATMAINHNTAMEDSAMEVALKGHTTEAYIVGFDGMLRSTRMAVKILPNLEKSITAVSQLKFKKFPEKGTLVLVDSQMNIVNGEKVFWDYFDKCETEEELKHMNQISRSIETATILLKQYECLVIATDADPTSISTDKVNVLNDEQDFENTILESLKELHKTNATKGIAFNIDRNSVYYDRISGNRIYARIEFSKGLDSDMIRVYIQLGEYQHKIIGPTRRNTKIKTVLGTSIKRDAIKNSSEKDSSSEEIARERLLSGPGLRSSRLGFEPIARESFTSDFEKIVEPATKVATRWKVEEVNNAGITFKDSVDTCTLGVGVKQSLVKKMFDTLICFMKEDHYDTPTLEQLPQVSMSPINRVKNKIGIKNEEMSDSEEKNRKKIDTPMNSLSPDKAIASKLPYRFSAIGSQMHNSNSALLDKVFERVDMKESTNTLDPLMGSYMLQSPKGAMSQITKSIAISAVSSILIRKEQRQKQQRLMVKTSKILIASSNSIAKILNKVMVDMN